MPKPCETVECRVQMLQDMYKAVEGTELLLDQIQIDSESKGKMSAQEIQANAYKTLIATVLSVRSKDETTYKVVEKLWKEYSTPIQLMKAPLEHVEELIHSSGTFHVKALHIKEIARIIHEDYHDEVPSDIDKLLALPGVGRKVANCVLVFAFNQAAIPVDTHVHRISNRTGWVITKKPEDTEKALEELFPKKVWTIMNYTLVSYGKTVCKPINPNCLACPVADRCPKLIQVKVKNEKKGNIKKNNRFH